ncbi:hypothetical protein [Actinomadura rubrisoli]|uniref:Uncharacterized protein n=1 Tax=Actinomadura rubrisoli TaxID=2530368 RepID=A0A4R5BM46_9ACTN|nr:hypothetical protein [Actinomadura rubrisoli]TDD86965.1 hypothetical protein E1298_16785 [Actinomadura rubrisoli]
MESTWYPREDFGVLKTWMIADYLRPYTQWRINRADPCDDGRNARAAIGLIDAAAYVMQLDDDEPVIVRMAIAGCFARGHFDPGPEGEALIRRWHYDEAVAGPAELFQAVAASAERVLRPEPGPRADRGGRPVAVTSGTGRGPALPRPREGEAAPA